MGSGKSTLARMIPRLYTPDSGTIAIDGKDIAQYDPDGLRREIAFMPQENDLFDLTIRNNIGMGLGAIDEAVFEEALDVSGVAQIAARRPSGYGFKAGAQGRKLSSGERQAVAMARTLARKAAIYVLDEPSSAMDGESERRLIARLKNRLAGKTVVVITHRAPVLALVDRVIWLDGGKVIADAPAADVVRDIGRRA